MSDYESLRNIADKLGMDRSHARRYIMRMGFTFDRIRDKESRQIVLALPADVAAHVFEHRRRSGFIPGDSVRPLHSGKGFFYVVQLVPDLDPLRIKLGFASDVASRLAEHRTAAPTAELAGHWPCRQCWERTAIDSITRSGCKQIGPEVFTCDDLAAVRSRADAFFAMMPTISHDRV